jgi:hypothetical protein
MASRASPPVPMRSTPLQWPPRAHAREDGRVGELNHARHQGRVFARDVGDVAHTQIAPLQRAHEFERDRAGRRQGPVLGGQGLKNLGIGQW